MTDEQKQDAWLLIKEKDQYARPSSEYSVVDEMPDSVSSLKNSTIENLRAAGKSAAHATERAQAAKKKTALPPGAIKAELPSALEPELATLVDGPPTDPEEWIYEIKFDGYRMLTRIDGGESRSLPATEMTGRRNCLIW